MRSNPTEQQNPKFKPGDIVVVVGPGCHRGRHGVVVDVTSHSGDFVYRYRIDFDGGENGVFFGFELNSSSG